LSALLSTGQPHGLIVDRDASEVSAVPIYDRRILEPFIRSDECARPGAIDEVRTILDCLSRLAIDVRAACAKHIVLCGDESPHRMRAVTEAFEEVARSPDLARDDVWPGGFPVSSCRLFRESAFAPLLLAWTGASLVSCLPNVRIDDTSSARLA
jgi:hypothetical protein